MNQTSYDWIDDKEIKSETENALRSIINLNSISILKNSVDKVIDSGDFKQLRDQIERIFDILYLNSPKGSDRQSNLKLLEEDIKSYTFLIENLFNILSRQSSENLSYNDMWKKLKNTIEAKFQDLSIFLNDLLK